MRGRVGRHQGFLKGKLSGLINGDGIVVVIITDVWRNDHWVESVKSSIASVWSAFKPHVLANFKEA